MTARTQGAHHIGLTVPDITATRAFFVDALGFEQVGEKPAYPAVFVSDGTLMITIWQAEDAATATPFNRRTNIGLHHLCLRAGNDENLDQLSKVLAARDDVSVEFSPEPMGASGKRHMMCAIPGGVRIEFIGA